MDASMYCLVDPDGRVHARLGVESFADIAREDGLDEHECQEYRFDLTTRRMLVDRATPSSALAAQEYVNQRFGSPARLMKFAEMGELPKPVLADLLNPTDRQTYLEACARIERKYTEACPGKHDPCLESGCSVEGGDEVCLQALMNAGIEYPRACAAEWIRLFSEPAHRIEVWRT